MSVDERAWEAYLVWGVVCCRPEEFAAWFADWGGENDPTKEDWEDACALFRDEGMCGEGRCCS